MRVERGKTRCSGFFCVAGVPMVLFRIWFIMDVMCILKICMGISLSSHEDHLGRWLIIKGWNSLTLGLAAQWLVMSMFMMTRTIVLMLDLLATCEGHFGPTENWLKHPGCLISLPSSPKQTTFGAQLWAGLGFAGLGAGVWLWPVPRLLLSAGVRRGRRLRGLDVVVGKNTAGLLLWWRCVERGHNS